MNKPLYKKVNNKGKAKGKMSDFDNNYQEAADVDDPEHGIDAI